MTATQPLWVLSLCHRAVLALALTSQPWWLSFHNWGAQGDSRAATVSAHPHFGLQRQCWEVALSLNSSSHHLTSKLRVYKQGKDACRGPEVVQLQDGLDWKDAAGLHLSEPWGCYDSASAPPLRVPLSLSEACSPYTDGTTHPGMCEAQFLTAACVKDRLLVPCD